MFDSGNLDQTPRDWKHLYCCQSINWRHIYTFTEGMFISKGHTYCLPDLSKIVKLPIIFSSAECYSQSYSVVLWQHCWQLPVCCSKIFPYYNNKGLVTILHCWSCGNRRRTTSHFDCASHQFFNRKGHSQASVFMVTHWSFLGGRAQQSVVSKGETTQIMVNYVCPLHMYPRNSTSHE